MRPEAILERSTWRKQGNLTSEDYIDVSFKDSNLKDDRNLLQNTEVITLM